MTDTVVDSVEARRGEKPCYIQSSRACFARSSSEGVVWRKCIANLQLSRCLRLVADHGRRVIKLPQRGSIAQPLSELREGVRACRVRGRLLPR